MAVHVHMVTAHTGLAMAKHIGQSQNSMNHGTTLESKVG